MLINAFGGCKYPPNTVCGCEPADAGAGWRCHEVAGTNADGGTDTSD